MSVVLTLKYKGKIKWSRVILSYQTWIGEGMKAPHSGEHSDLQRVYYPSWLPKDQTSHLSWQANSLEASKLSEGFCCDHGNPHLPAVSHLLSIMTRTFPPNQGAIYFCKWWFQQNGSSPGCNPAFQVGKFKPFLGCSSGM